MKLHRLRNTQEHAGGVTFTVVGHIEKLEDGTKIYYMGSASGPVEPMFIDLGPLEEGNILKYHYDHINKRFCPEGWECVVTRINRKSITVQSRDGFARIEI